MDDTHDHGANGIMCGHVFRGERPLRLVMHCPDGSFDFMCGEEDHDTVWSEGIAHVVCKFCAVKKQQLPFRLEDLPVAHNAEYFPKQEKWVFSPMDEEDLASFNDA